MPIQFQCLTCNKPIEIDDEFAGQAVTCPYCRKVMNAPAGLMPGAVTASAIPSAGAVLAPPIGSFQPMQPPPIRANWFATIGLLCSLLMIFFMCIGMAGAVKVVKQIQPDMQLQQSQMKEVSERAAKEPLVVAASALMLLTAIIGVIFSILGLTRRTGRRWQAIVGVVVCGLMLACGFLNIIASMVSTGAAAGS